MSLVRSFSTGRCAAPLVAAFIAALSCGCGTPGGSGTPEAGGPEGPGTDDAAATTAVDSVTVASDLASALARGEPTFQDQFAEPIEQAHADSVWASKEALTTAIRVVFGGETRFHGQMLMETGGANRVRIDLDGDTVAVFDGETAWVAPTAEAFPRPRFNLRTWAYFAAAPYKLRDPGTRIASRGYLPAEKAGEGADSGMLMPVGRLTFSAGTGDSPDDWYMLYRNPETNRLAAMGYIVTYGAASAQEATPHAIVYDDYQNVDGVPVPTAWTFYHWSASQGPHGDPIGHVTLRDPRFIDPPKGVFAPPPGAEASGVPAE